jgi:hypothetical protein
MAAHIVSEKNVTALRHVPLMPVNGSAGQQKKISLRNVKLEDKLCDWIIAGRPSMELFLGSTDSQTRSRVRKVLDKAYGFATESELTEITDALNCNEIAKRRERISNVTNGLVKRFIEKLLEDEATAGINNKGKAVTICALDDRLSNVAAALLSTNQGSITSFLQRAT